MVADVHVNVDLKSLPLRTFEIIIIIIIIIIIMIILYNNNNDNNVNNYNHITNNRPFDDNI